MKRQPVGRHNANPGQLTVSKESTFPSDIDCCGTNGHQFPIPPVPISFESVSSLLWQRIALFLWPGT